MHYIWLISGYIIGSIVTLILRRSYLKHKQVYGRIYVDNTTNQCRIHILQKDLGNPSVKYVIFEVHHNSKIPIQDDDSRNEHSL